MGTPKKHLIPIAIGLVLLVVLIAAASTYLVHNPSQTDSSNTPIPTLTPAPTPTPTVTPNPTATPTPTPIPTTTPTPVPTISFYGN